MEVPIDTPNPQIKRCFRGVSRGVQGLPVRLCLMIWDVVDGPGHGGRSQLRPEFRPEIVRVEAVSEARTQASFHIPTQQEREQLVRGEPERRFHWPVVRVAMEFKMPRQFRRPVEQRVGDQGNKDGPSTETHADALDVRRIMNYCEQPAIGWLVLFVSDELDEVVVTDGRIENLFPNWLPIRNETIAHDRERHQVSGPENTDSRPVLVKAAFR